MPALYKMQNSCKSMPCIINERKPTTELKTILYIRIFKKEKEMNFIAWLEILISKKKKKKLRLGWPTSIKILEKVLFLGFLVFFIWFEIKRKKFFRFFWCILSRSALFGNQTDTLRTIFVHQK